MTALGLEVRAGLHTGEVELVGDDVAGLAVHIAARVMGEAPPGRVLASSTVHDLVVGSGLRFEDRGRRELRGVPGEWGLWEVDRVNFARDVVEAAPPERLAMVELARDGARREWRFGEVAEQAGLLAAHLGAHGARRGDVVLTLLGNRPEWVLAMVACFRAGYAVLPCTEQLRPKDLRCASRSPSRRSWSPTSATATCSRRRAGTARRVGAVGRAAAPRRAAARRARRPATRASSRSPPAPRASRRRCCTARATCPASGCRPSTGWPRRTGDLVWCTAASGWSKSARNAFIAPWLRGAAALLHDARFDPAERLEIAEREGVNVLCMAPTEYRVIANRAQPRRIGSLRGLVAAGEALDPDVLGTWHEATGLWIRDGYGQTETGQLTGHPPGAAPRPGSMGRPLPGRRAHRRRTASSRSTRRPTRRSSCATSARRRTPARGAPATSCAPDEDGYLYFESRADDVIVSAGYRIGPFEVESALVAHPAVADAAAVSAPDRERGAVVRAIVVLRDGHEPSDALARELQDHVKAETAPYKYPRIVEFADALPRTTSGKVRRAELRSERAG